MKSTLKILLLLVAIVFTFPVNAGIKCWKTHSGIRECGYQVPNEYRKSRIEILNKNGVVVRVIAAPKNKQQLAQDAIRKKELAKIAERKRKDNILLKTFTTERDLIIARENRLAAVQGLIEITEGNNNNVKYKLQNLREQAGDYERSGKKLPLKLINDIKLNDEQIIENKNYIKKRLFDLSKIRKDFKHSLDRFRYLKSNQSKPRN